MSNVRESIILKLMHEPGMRFNELWAKEGTSNNFAYHLKTLEDDGLIIKSGEQYELTEKGKQESNYIEGSTGKKVKQPLLGVIILITREDKFLCLKRKKEPFFGVVGFIGGKINFNQTPLEAAKDELLQEAGLQVPLQIKGIQSYKTYNNGKLAYNHQMFTFVGKYDGSQLIADNREGTLHWFTKEELAKEKVFPNAQWGIDMVGQKGFTWITADRVQENGEFTEIKVVDKQVF